MEARKTAVSVVAGMLLVILVPGADVKAVSVAEAVAYWDFNDGLPLSAGLSVSGGEVAEAAGKGGQTVNIAAGPDAANVPIGWYSSGAIGALPPDNAGYGFWGGYINMGTGAGNELDLAGAPGISIVWRMRGSDPVGRWSSGKGLVFAMPEAATGWADRQYLVDVSATGQNSARIGFLVSGPGWSWAVMDMANDFNMMQWATYACVYDGAAGQVTISAWGDDGDTHTYVNSVAAGTVGAVSAHPRLLIGAECNSDGVINPDTYLRHAEIDGIAIFDRALTQTEIVNLQPVPIPTTLSLCLIGGLALLAGCGRKRSALPS